MAQALAAAQDEIAQLHGTITSLRESLEMAGISREDAISAIRTQHQAELSQLQSTVRALRDRIEAATGDIPGR